MRRSAAKGQGLKPLCRRRRRRHTTFTILHLLSGCLLLTGVPEVLQPGGPELLLPAGLLLLLLLLVLLRLPHQDGVRLRRIRFGALPPPALQHAGLLLPVTLLAGPAGGLLRPRLHVLLHQHRVSLRLSGGGELFQEGFVDGL